MLAYGSQTPIQNSRLKAGIRVEAEHDGNPDLQHSKLLEPSKVVLMDPSDVVAVELPGERGRRKQ